MYWSMYLIGTLLGSQYDMVYGQRAIVLKYGHLIWGSEAPIPLPLQTAAI